MAILKSDAVTSDLKCYHLGDYELQKQEYLKGIEEQAHKIIATAEAKAKQVLQDAYRKGVEKAKEEVEKEKANAKEKGYQEGLDLARNEIVKSNEEKVAAELTPLIQEISGLAKEVKLKKDELCRDAEMHLVRASISLAKNIILVEVNYNENVLKERLRKALSFIKTGMELQINLNPKKLEMVQAYLPKLLDEFGEPGSIAWKSDESISASGVEVKSGDVQVKLDTNLQWQSLLKEMKKKGLVV